MNGWLGIADAAGLAALGTKELVFLSLWVVFTPAYWASYRASKPAEHLIGAALKVAALLGFVWAVITGLDWLAAEVAAEQIVSFGIGETPTEPGPRVPLLADAFMWLVLALLVLVAWHARRKFSTVCGVVLSAWDRGHWYLLPVIFILMTVGLLLVAAAASPVLSPFIYTLF